MGSLRTGLLHEQPLVFVDIETNGLNHIRGRVIEVAAIRIEQGRIVKTFNQLIDPQTELPHFITQLTGIQPNDLSVAPVFAEIAQELYEVLEGAIFIAHNVRFDYSFLKQEFKRVNMTFSPKQLCTVRLSRALYPHETSHKLQSLISRYGFTYGKRHRAYDDAAVLWQFVQYIQKHFPPEQIQAALAKQIKTPALPQAVDPALIADLPESAGVYLFEDSEGRILYVGKSINIKKRVLSHFSSDHSNVKEFKMAQTVARVEARETPGELSALLLESRLVKELQPIYNRQLRRLQKLAVVTRITHDDGYYGVTLSEQMQIDPTQATDVLAVYPRRGRAKIALQEVVRTFDLCPKLMGLEKSSGACFLHQLRKCRGACVGKETAASYNQRLLTAFDNQRIQAWPFAGPVLFSEAQPGEGSHAIIVDNWCVLGELTQEPYCEPVVTTAEQAFDLDAYAILRRQLRSKALSIRPFTMQAQLDF